MNLLLIFILLFSTLVLAKDKPCHEFNIPVEFINVSKAIIQKIESRDHPESFQILIDKIDLDLSKIQDVINIDYIHETVFPTVSNKDDYEYAIVVEDENIKHVFLNKIWWNDLFCHNKTNEIEITILHELLTLAGYRKFDDYYELSVLLVKNSNNHKNPAQIIKSGGLINKLKKPAGFVSNYLEDTIKVVPTLPLEEHLNEQLDHFGTTVNLKLANYSIESYDQWKVNKSFSQIEFDFSHTFFKPSYASTKEGSSGAFRVTIKGVYNNEEGIDFRGYQVDIKPFISKHNHFIGNIMSLFKKKDVLNISTLSGHEFFRIQGDWKIMSINEDYDIFVKPGIVILGGIYLSVPKSIESNTQRGLEDNGHTFHLTYNGAIGIASSSKWKTELSFSSEHLEYQDDGYFQKKMGKRNIDTFGIKFSFPKVMGKPNFGYQYINYTLYMPEAYLTDTNYPKIDIDKKINQFYLNFLWRF